MISEAAIKVFEMAAGMCRSEDDLKKWIASDVNKKTIDGLKEPDKAILRDIYSKARERLRGRNV